MKKGVVKKRFFGFSQPSLFVLVFSLGQISAKTAHTSPYPIKLLF